MKPKNDPEYPNDRSRHGQLVHEVTSEGRYVYIVAYLEGGDRPIKSQILCRTSEQAAEIARVLSEARTR